jgi:hypothetical protein
MKKSIIIILLFLITVDFVYSQNQTVLNTGNPELKGFKTKNFLQLTLQGGFMVPAGNYFADNYNTGGAFGFDLAYRVNTEVALYTEIKCNLMSLKDTLGPATEYFEGTVGVRFYFRPKCYRSSFFIEAGVGPYIFSQGSATTPNTIYDSKTEFRMGSNAGIGGELVLTNSLFITLKSKLNTIFYPFGSTTYVSGAGGFTIRF